MTHPRRFTPYNWTRKHFCPDCGIEHENRSGLAVRCPECAEKHEPVRRKRANAKYYRATKAAEIIAEVLS